jgi:hypothetical protein
MTALPPPIEDAIEAFNIHPAVTTIVGVNTLEDGSFIIEAVFDTNLPSRWRKAGVTPDGVRSSENVEVCFPLGYPSKAPRFSLRPDFNPNLPHINPHSKGKRIPPCILAGSNLELLHSEGIFGLIGQMSEWLKNAGRQSLINLAQGWEPMRRDHLNDHIFLDPESLLNSKKFGRHHLYYSTCWRVKSTGGTLSSYPRRWDGAVVQPQQFQKLFDTKPISEDIEERQSLVVVCWPSSAGDELPAVNDQYLPDTVETVADLNSRVYELGCTQAFEAFSGNINQVAKQTASELMLPILLIFPVRRPTHLIGSNSEYEFICYKVEATTPAMFSDTSARVFAVTFLSPVTKDLLRRTSGLPSDREGLAITYLGCGSVGSKLALHSTRSGFPPTLLVDQEQLAPHNVARHALFPRHCNLFSKAKTLANEIAAFDAKKPKVIVANFIDHDLVTEPFHSALNGSGKIMLNTTGSHAVRQYLASSKFTARVIEGCLTNQGKAGILTTEGNDRNPNCDDLMVAAYDSLRINHCLSAPMSQEESMLRVGVGCNSVTLPMSDTRLSLITAGMSQVILDSHVQGLPEAGRISVGLVGEDGMSVHWQHKTLQKSHLAKVSGLPGWKVRVLDIAHQKIITDVAKYPTVETGGLVVGRCSPIQREVIILDVLDAPPDSIRSSSKFVLGVDGLRDNIMQYNGSGANVLWCLGTWHSHLQPSGPSVIDMTTSKSIEGLLKGAVVMLIKHSQGYEAIVVHGRLE